MDNIQELPKGFFLRDDTEMRKDWEWLMPEEYEAYSLFRKEPYERLEVFCGSYEWAITKAIDNIAGGVYNE